MTKNRDANPNGLAFFNSKQPIYMSFARVHLGFLHLTNSFFFSFLFRSSESSSGAESGNTSSSRSSSDDEKASRHVSAHKNSNSTHTESKNPKNLGIPSVASAHCDSVKL